MTAMAQAFTKARGGKRAQLTPEARDRAQSVINENLLAWSLAHSGSDGRTIRGKSPWVPSLTATARVPHPQPAPDTCGCCGGRSVECVHHDLVYGRAYGEWPWMYRCLTCEATVGMHPFTNIPLGTLATRAMRSARTAAQAAFNPLFESGGMTRHEAYEWLAAQLGIANVEQCHIGLFDIETCIRVVEVCRAYDPDGDIPV